MSKVAVVYWSMTGNTEAMAQAVAAGAKEKGAECELITGAALASFTPAAYSGVALGCPSMGVEELESGEFAPMFEGIKAALVGKKVALFGSYGWGDGMWMRQWQADCAAQGIQLVGEPVIISGAPDATCEKSCQDLGAALA